MSDITEHTLLAFRDELRKEAGFADVVARAAPRLKNISSLGGVGATLGGLGGAGIGAVRQYQAAREGGAGLGQAAMSGLGGAVHGGSVGALAGGLAGAGAGSLMKSDLSGLAQHGGLVGVGSRFGQRQMHALTGALSPHELEAVRGGAYGARQAVRGAERGLAGAWGAPTVNPKAVGKQMGTLARSRGGLAATEAATGMKDPSMNLTSVPGMLRSAKEHGAGKVLKTGLREQIANTNPALAALMIGAPAAAAVGTLASKEDVDAQGRGKGERLGENVGQTVGGVVGGVMPLVGQSVVGGGLRGAGKYLGRGVDRLRGKGGTPGLSPATSLEQAEGQHMPSERVMSPAAAGQQPDIGI